MLRQKETIAVSIFATKDRAIGPNFQFNLMQQTKEPPKNCFDKSPKNDVSEWEKMMNIVPSRATSSKKYSAFRHTPKIFTYNGKLMTTPVFNEDTHCYYDRIEHNSADDEPNTHMDYQMMCDIMKWCDDCEFE